MAHPPVDDHEFVIGLDLDSEDREVKNGFSRYVLNGRSGTSDTNKVGTIESIRGNKSWGTLIVGEKVIGSAEDIKNNAVIFFVHNNTNRTLTYTGAAVANPSPSAQVVISGPSEPLPAGMRLVITQGLNVFTGRITNQVFTTYSLSDISGALNTDPITSIQIMGENLIRRWYKSESGSFAAGSFENLTNPGLMGAVLAFQLNKKIHNPRVIESSFGQLLTWTDGNVAPRLTNIDKMKVGGVYYSIASDEQYIYLGKRPPLQTMTVMYVDVTDNIVNFIKDKFYQFSYRYVYDNNEISSSSDYSDVAIPDPNLSKNDGISFTFNTGHKTVVKIEVMVRFGNGVSSTQNPEWYIFNTFDKAQLGYSDNVTETAIFTGDESLKSVARVYTDTTFYTVPYLADHIEVVSEKDNNSEIILAGITEGDGNPEVDIDISFYNQLGQIVIPAAGASDFFIRNPFAIPDLDVGPQPGDLLNINILILPSGSDNAAYTLLAADLLTFTAYINKIVDLLNATGYFTTVSSSILGDDATVTAVDGTGTYVINTLTVSNPHIKRGLKDLSKIDVGIVYQENLYRGTGVINIVRAKQVNSQIIYDSGSYQNYLFVVPQFKATINSLAPLGFTKYHFVVTEGSIVDFLQTYISAQSLHTVTLETAYNFSAGDRIRWRYGAFGDVTSIEDHLIESYDSSTKIVTFTGDLVNSPKFGVVELYTPNRVQELYFETSQSFNITDQLHEGNIQTQTDLLPSISYFGGNSYYERQANVDVVYMIINEPFYSLKYESNFWWKGRVQVETPNQKRLYIGTLRRWSLSLVDVTQINNLGVWYEGNYNNDLGARFGSITGMRQRGYTLTTFQWANTNKNFLGRREVTNADGSSELVVTDSLLSETNPSEQGYGTMFPGSIVMGDDDLYFFDVRKGEYCVDNNANGVFPISSMGASIYWRNASDLVKSDPDFEVISGFDGQYKDLYGTVKNPVTGYSQTLYFNAKQKQWKSEYEMFGEDGTPIDWYGGVGKTFVAFLNGGVWEQNVLSEDGVPVYCKLFGAQRKFINEFITNVDKKKVKVYMTHEMHVNTAPVITKLSTPKDDMYPNGMYTELWPGNYDYKEGVYYAAIKQDAYTKGIPLNDTQKRENIARGRAIRGHALVVRMEWETPDYVILMSSGIGQIGSEKS